MFEGEHSFRQFNIDVQLYFDASTACRIAAVSNVSKAVSRLDADEYRAITSSDTAGRPNEITVVSEAGLYALILSFRKRKPKSLEDALRFEALGRFKRWVTHEVLPQIRRTGEYSIPAPPGTSNTETHTPPAETFFRTKRVLIQ